MCYLVAAIFEILAKIIMCKPKFTKYFCVEDLCHQLPLEQFMNVFQPLLLKIFLKFSKMS